MIDWLTLGGDPVRSLEDMPEGTFGFVYLIQVDDGRWYIGRKQVVSRRKKRFGKRRIAAMEDKRGRKWEWVEKEMDWQGYLGSSEALQEYLDGDGEVTHRIILYFAHSRKALTYYEMKALFERDALGSEVAFNDNIAGKFFRRDLDVEKPEGEQAEDGS